MRRIAEAAPTYSRAQQKSNRGQDVILTKKKEEKKEYPEDRKSALPTPLTHVRQRGRASIESKRVGSHDMLGTLVVRLRNFVSQSGSTAKRLRIYN